MSRSVTVTKVIKQGFGRTINSEFGYSSFDIQPTTLEVNVDPPIDLTTEEGKEAYRKLQENLTRMSMRILEEDVNYYCDANEELRRTLVKKKMLMDKVEEAE